MIGVLAKPEEYELVREFFELFKTPWEFYRPEQQYDVVLCAREDVCMSDITASLVVIYAGQETPLDRAERIGVEVHRNGGALVYRGMRIPIYGDIFTFLDAGLDLLREEQSRQSAGVRRLVGGKKIVRLGYDLFRELRTLLVDGQPTTQAGSPTVEMHIALLRDRIVEAGIPLVEIPPIPEGHTFIACLTHDVDHPSIRRHQWDHTAFGFLHRAVVGSVLDVLRGRVPVRHLVVNWVAAVKLPFVYLGLARDFWLDLDRYLDIEQDLNSTFFVLPFKGRPGETGSGSAPRIRASGYGAADIAERLKTLAQSGREIGLHGIDAWINNARGEEEKSQITQITGGKDVGIRMHWLYFNECSPTMLEKAGFSYDSTVGYNETIGYRAGTTQVYKPLQTRKLLELPLHVMDTALFYPDYLHLSFDDADKQVGVLLDNAVRFGGVVTINWHDRSIAPERLWGEFYRNLVDQLKKRKAWCASAGETIAWFQRRRSVAFHQGAESIEITVPDDLHPSAGRVPGLKVRTYNLDQDSCHTYIDSMLSASATIQLLRGQSFSCP